MPLGGFGLLSLFYVVIGIRFLYQFIPRRKAVFDNNFTPHDRSMLGQAAFFILIPVSVALHELGHAVAIWAMGGTVIAFEFFFFSGSVTPGSERLLGRSSNTLVAFAGTFVNLLLIVIALAVVFLKKPPLRAPWNELLLQFVFISGINALIFYPLMDLALNISGDWSQMYRSGVPWLTAIIVITQVAFIAAGWWGMKNPGMRERIAKLTGLPAGSSMRMSFGSGGEQAVRKVERIDAAKLSGDEKVVGSAIARVAAGWPHKTDTRIDRGQGGSVSSLSWQSNGAGRTAAVVIRPSGETAIVGNVHSSRDPGAPANQGMLRSWPTLPPEDDLTMALRLAAEQIDGWSPIPQGARG